jgi:ribonuclease HII
VTAPPRKASPKAGPKPSCAACATRRFALDQIQPRPEHVLIDGLRIKWLTYAQTALVEGDCKSYSIAAASVLAKVTRDRLMADYDRQYPGYGFGNHKGYATPQHYAAIKQLGACPIHRRSFAPFRPAVVEPELGLFAPAANATEVKVFAAPQPNCPPA